MLREKDPSDAGTGMPDSVDPIAELVEMSSKSLLTSSVTCNVIRANTRIIWGEQQVSIRHKLELESIDQLQGFF